MESQSLLNIIEVEDQQDTKIKILPKVGLSPYKGVKKKEIHKNILAESSRDFSSKNMSPVNNRIIIKIGGKECQAVLVEDPAAKNQLLENTKIRLRDMLPKKVIGIKQECNSDVEIEEANELKYEVLEIKREKEEIQDGLEETKSRYNDTLSVSNQSYIKTKGKQNTTDKLPVSNQAYIKIKSKESTTIIINNEDSDPEDGSEKYKIRLSGLNSEDDVIIKQECSSDVATTMEAEEVKHEEFELKEEEMILEHDFEETVSDELNTEDDSAEIQNGLIMPKELNRGIRGKWSENNMQKAIAAVKNGMSQNSASKQFSVPRRTLRDYLQKNKYTKCGMGRKSTLTQDQEQELCSGIIRLAEVGYPLTSKVLRRCVFNFCDANSICHPFNKEKKMAGHKWMWGFFNRNPQIRIRIAQSMNPVRAQKLNPLILNDHFTKLRSILTDLQIIDKPQCIYNMDKKGFRLSLNHQQCVLAKKGAKRVHLVANEHGQNVTITIVSCGNAMGSAVPPLILFKGKRMKQERTDSLPPGSMALMTPDGSMTIEAFKLWLNNFAKYKAPGPCILIFDGAKFHLDHSVVTVAEELGITLYCLPSNTTHEFQPMANAVFRSFEHYWDDEVLKYWSNHRNRSLTKQRFGTIFSIVWDKSVTPSNIKSGFSTTGIFPFNPFAPSIITEKPVEPCAQDRDKSQSPGPSNTAKLMIKKKLSNPLRQPGKRQLKEFSSSDDSDDNSLSEPSEIINENDVFFADMLATPDMTQKTNVKPRNPAINSSAQVVTNDLFKKSTIQGNAFKPITTIFKKIASKNKTMKKKKTETWYCKACGNDRVADLRLCVRCKSYLHDKCLGLTIKDQADRFIIFICPYCL